MGGVSPGGWGVSNIVIHTYVGSGQFWGFKILNFNIFGGGGVKKNECFWGMKILWIFLG